MSLVTGQLIVSATAAVTVTVTDQFASADDLAIDGSYSSNPGGDGEGADAFGVDKPLILSTSGFTSVGSAKLAGVLTLHNSAARVSDVTGLTYGGGDIFSNIIVENGAGSGNAFSTQIIFYLDGVATHGDLIISLGTDNNVDEAGLALFYVEWCRDRLSWI